MFFRDALVDVVANQAEEIINARLPRRAHVKDAASGVIERRGVGPNDVFHKNIVAGLLAVAVDDRLFAVQHTLRKDCHDAGLAIWVLAGSVDGQDRKSTRLNSSHVALSYA